MSHVFDTGLTVPQRTLILDAAVDVLSLLKRPNGYLAAVKGFGGIVRTYTDELGVEWLQKALGASPAIGVTLETRSFKVLAIGGRQAVSDLQVTLYFLSQHSRDPLLGRHKTDSIAAADAHADPGLHTIMEHAIELMHGTYPSLTTGTVKQLRIDLEREVATLPHCTIWQQIYNVTLQSYTGSREYRTAEQLITSLHWRTTTNPDEPNRPAPAVDSTTIDADSDPP